MTDDKTEVIENAARSGRDPKWRLRIRVVLVWLALSVITLGVVVALQYSNTNSLRGQVDTLAAQQSHAADVAQRLAGQLSDLGVKPVAQPPPPVTQPGPAGKTGPAGRGITGTQITGGHLIVVYSDGHTQDAGRVVGATGATGKAGRGITGTRVTDGHLMVAYSDGTAADLGSIVGPKGDSGRGVTSTTVDADFHLIVTYSDGTTADAGPLPAGPTGPAGPKGDKGDKGDRGDAGPACPSGFSPRPAVITEPDGSTHQGVACVSDSDTGTPAPPTTTSPSGLLGIHN